MKKDERRGEDSGCILYDVSNDRYLAVRKVAVYNNNNGCKRFLLLTLLIRFLLFALNARENYNTHTHTRARTHIFDQKSIKMSHKYLQRRHYIFTGISHARYSRRRRAVTYVIGHSIVPLENTLLSRASSRFVVAY